MRELSKTFALAGRKLFRRKPSAAGTRLLYSTRLAFEPLETRLLLEAGPIISEFMAANNSTLLDGDGDSSDWIEIYNPTAGPVNLVGWHLTDDPADLEQWEFPDAPEVDLNLGPGEYLLVMASGKGDDDQYVNPQGYYVDTSGYLHTSFKLNADATGDESVALVERDGVTVAHAYWDFLEQYSDVSFGIAQKVVPFLAEGARLTYLVPTEAVSNWRDPEFGDADWVGSEAPPPIVITEIGTRKPDFIEIQNVSSDPVDPAGWFVAINSPTDGINGVNAETWSLSDEIAPAEVLYRSNEYYYDPGDPVAQEHYWGNPINFGTTGPGWAMIVNGEGGIADFVVWGYAAADLATLDVTVGGVTVTYATLTAWQGAPVPRNTRSTYTLQRAVDGDRNNAADWLWTGPGTMGTQNAALTLPFPGPPKTGIGFSVDPAEFGGAIRTDVQADMYARNGSILMRIPFTVDDLANLESLKLRMRYNDGFVAYLNGQRITGRNDPASPAWNSQATTTRSVAASLAAESIDVTAYLGSLQLGPNLLAVHGLNHAAADDNFLIVPELIGVSTEETEQHFIEPTPGDPNSTGVIGYVADTKFNVDRGLFDFPFQLVITTDTPEALIRYTTDGSEPTLTRGEVFPGMLTIDRTTTVRAAAFKAGYAPSDVDTQTYVFLDDVLQQPANPADMPTTWGVYTYGGSAGQPRPANYEVDPQVVNDPRYRDTILDDLRSIPTMSVVLDPDDLWDDTIGIYSNSLSQGVTWERAGSVELIYADGSIGFQDNVGVRIHGGWGRRPSQNAKHSFRLLWKSEYGPTKLRFPLFGDDAADEFDTIVLRAGFNDSWRGSANSTYLQDRWAAQTQLDMDGLAGHGTWVHLYLNGLYWGLYNPVERPNAAFAASYLGGEKEDYDAYRTGRITDGNTIAWNQLLGLVRQNPIDYAAVEDVLNVPEFIDYMMLNHLGGNWDWPHNNWYASRRREPGGQWRFHSWDAEGVLMRGINDSRVNAGGNNSSGEIYLALRSVDEFRLLFADRIHRNMFNDGQLTPQANIARLDALAAQIDRAIVGESARWGDGRFDNVSPPRTRDDHWIPRLNYLRTTYLPQRTDVVIQQYRGANLYPNLAAPEFNQHGGDVAAGFPLDVTAPGGTIYYTLDGFDPRGPGGAVSARAQIYNGTPVPLDKSTVVKARVRNGSTWSALNEAEFRVGGLPVPAGPLVITEINYDPYDPTPAELAVNANLVAADFEFIEVQNTGDDRLDLAAYHFTDGIAFDLTNPVQLAVGQRAVIVNNSAAFAQRYGNGPTVLGEYDGFLDNNGEHIVMKRQGLYDEVLFDFSYNDGGNWPGKAAGKGASLVMIDAAAVPRSGQLHEDYLENDDNWRSSVEYGGSPGTAGLEATRDIVVNEVLTHTDWPSVDAIELHNTGDQPVDIAGWYLSDSWGWASSEDNGNYKKYQIPVLDLGEQGKTLLGPGEYIVFDEGDFNQSGGADVDDFALNSPHGDDVWLMRADAAGNLTEFADHAEFPSAANGESLGRWPTPDDDFYPMSAVTLAAANSGPRIGPVIISELMYNPPDPDGPGGMDPGDLEFVELFNPTAQTIELAELLDNPQQPGTQYLADWRLRKGVDMEFDPGDTLASGATLVVLSFNPDKPENAARVTAFRNYYGIDASVALAGGYGGSLDNGGERIRLQRPDSPPADEPDFVPHYLEDEINYDDLAPWPVSADGLGDSLHRLGTDLWGNDPASWEAAAASPGAVELIVAPQVAGRYVFYHNSAFSGDAAIAPTPQQLLDGGKDPKWGKTALLSGERATFQNYSTYSLGLNGIVVDIANLPAATTQLTTADFQFRVGNSSDLGTWSDPAATPAPQNIALDTSGPGPARATITWANNAIGNQWLEVKVKATGATGLAADDVFYFGNTTGEVGNTFGDAAPEALVTYADLIQTRNNIVLAAEVTIENGFDFNRDRFVTYSDLILCRNNIDLTSGLNLITAPATAAPQAAVGAGAIHDVALEKLFVDTEPAAVESASLADLVWLHAYQQLSASSRPAAKPHSAEQAVDKMSAWDHNVIWPLLIPPRRGRR